MQSLFDTLKTFSRWFLVDTRDPKLALAQCKELNFQIPLLYLVLMVNAIALSYTHRDVAPGYLTLGVLAPMLLLTTIRLLAWVRSRKNILTPEQAIRKLRKTIAFAGLMAILYTSWSLSLDAYGGEIERGHVALFVAITVIGCIFCLMHLPQAAILVMLCVTVPYLIHYLGEQQDVYTAIALNIFLVSLGILKVLLNGFNAFSNLIKSQSEVAAKQLETERLNAENERLSQTDFLTGLPNRRYFFQKLDRDIDERNGREEAFAVGVIDLDHFKPVNDTYGHLVGDQLLTAVGQRIGELNFPDFDVSRLGGDEFGFIYLGTPEKAEDIARSICECLRQPFQIGDVQITVGASCGIALYPDAGSTTHTLFDRADYALYNAKTTARGGVTIYSAAHEAQIRSERAVETALQHADIPNEFEVHFQPLISLSDLEVTGFEALARWTSPEIGRIPPDVFIQVAERTGQIQRLTVHLFQIAVDQLASLPDNLRMSFNLSAHDITSMETVATLLANSKGKHIDPTRITFEITETSVIGSYETAENCMTTLRAAGCRLALDDFGTGYSSLGYLHRLPIDCVKIDRSFVANLTDPAASGVVTSVVDLCRSMELTCVVEGVEEDSQVEALKKLNCQFVQGYFFSAPKPFGEIAESIATTGAVAGLPLAKEVKAELLRPTAI